MADRKPEHAARLALWQEFTREEADLVEDRIRSEAKKSGVPYEMLMDALTMELTGAS